MMVFRFVLVSALCLVSLFLNAQKELEFNKVINEKITGNGGLIIKTVTVPKGKVWKITAASAGFTSSSKGTYLGSSEIALTLGDISLFYRNTSTYTTRNFPFWIPEGTYTMKLFCKNILSTLPLAGTISVIEFNVK